MYKGYLLKIGGLTLPYADPARPDKELIDPETYKVGVNKEKIVEWTDYNNDRHAVYSTGAQAQISFQTHDAPFLLTEEDIEIIQEALENAKYHVTGLNADAYRLEFFNPSTAEYEIAKDFTLDDLTYTINGCSENHVYYNPIRFVFTEVSVID